MKSLIRMLTMGVAFSLAIPAGAQQAAPWDAVARTLGRTGEEKDGVYRVAFPRSDLKVSVRGVRIRTGLALTSWAAFQNAGNEAMVMGDLVLAAAELPAVTSVLAQNGMEITAVHNHLAGEAPRVMYVHFHGHGDAEKLAATLRAALGKTGTPPPRPAGISDGQVAAPNTATLEHILGHKSTTRGSVVNFTIPRGESISGGGGALGPRMGLGTVINFQKDARGAATTGDFVLLAPEVQPVIRALRANGIDVTALHNHMLDEQPRLFFLHFWGRGTEEHLARGLRAALDQTNHRRP